MKRILRALAAGLLIFLCSAEFTAVLAETDPVSAVREETPEPPKEDPTGILYEMNFYSEGLFGYGEEGNFRQWSIAHFAPILLTVGLIIAVYKNRETIRKSRYEEDFRFGLVAVMIICEMSYFWRLLYCGPADVTQHNMLDKLPLQVCQWTLLLTSLMAAKKSKRLFSVCFFLTMTVGLLPLLFPAVITIAGPTYYRYYQFWGEHLLPIFTVYYMMFVHNMKVKYTGIIGAAVMLVLLAIPAIYVNRAVPSANYLYLKTDQYAMLSFLPKSEWLMLCIYAAVLMCLCGIVWGIYRMVTSRRKAKA